MTEAWTQAVRSQLDLGRLLPLGGPHDGTWITEQAAVQALVPAAAEVPGVRLESVRIGSAPLQPVFEPAVRPPISALPPGPLTIEAAFTASLAQPLPETAEALRSALLGAAVERLGLATVSADMRVTDVREVPEAGVPSVTAATGVRPTPEAAAMQSSPPVTATTVPLTPEAAATRNSPPVTATTVPPAPEAAATRNSPPVTGTEPVRGVAGELAYVAAGVPGVARLTAVLGSRPVRVEDHDDPPGRHIEVHLAVGPGHHPLTVARAVREAVAGAAATTDPPGPVTVAVLITETAAWSVTTPVTVMSTP